MAEQNLNASKSGRRKTVVMGGALLGLMAVEAVVVLFLVRNFSGGPQQADARPPGPGIELTDGGRKPEAVELEVVKLRAQNERSQRQMIYNLEVFVSASETDSQRLSEILGRRKATVQDRLTRVIRAADPERFVEPDLRTLRKQFRTELNEIVGDDKLIHEVLIPSIVSSES